MNELTQQQLIDDLRAGLIRAETWQQLDEETKAFLYDRAADPFAKIADALERRGLDGGGE